MRKFSENRHAWLGKDSNLEIGTNWKTLSPRPREAAELLSFELHNSLETSEFSRAVPNRWSPELRRETDVSENNKPTLPISVRSSIEKSLLLLGLIANKFTRRIHGFGPAGGGRGTGVEPSPGTPS